MSQKLLPELRASLVIREIGRNGQGVRFDCPICNCGCEDKRITIWFSNPVDGKPQAAILEGEHVRRREGIALEQLTLSEPVTAILCGHTVDVRSGVVSFEER